MATSPEVGGLACAKMIEQTPVLVDMLVGYIHRGAREREVEASRLRESLRRAVPLVKQASYYELGKMGPSPETNGTARRKLSCNLLASTSRSRADQ